VTVLLPSREFERLVLKSADTKTPLGDRVRIKWAVPDPEPLISKQESDTKVKLPIRP